MALSQRQRAAAAGFLRWWIWRRPGPGRTTRR